MVSTSRGPRVAPRPSVHLCDENGPHAVCLASTGITVPRTIEQVRVGERTPDCPRGSGASPGRTHTESRRRLLGPRRVLGVFVKRLLPHRADWLTSWVRARLCAQGGDVAEHSSRVQVSPRRQQPGPSRCERGNVCPGPLVTQPVCVLAGHRGTQGHAPLGEELSFLPHRGRSRSRS